MNDTLKDLVKYWAERRKLKLGDVVYTKNNGLYALVNNRWRLFKKFEGYAQLQARIDLPGDIPASAIPEIDKLIKHDCNATDCIFAL